MSCFSFDTVWPADTVEFCPHPDAVDIVVCGTYNLEKEHLSPTDKAASDDSNQAGASRGQLRRGQCLLFALDRSGHTGGEDPGYTLWVYICDCVS